MTKSFVLEHSLVGAVWILLLAFKFFGIAILSLIVFILLRLYIYLVDLKYEHVQTKLVSFVENQLKHAPRSGLFKNEISQQKFSTFYQHFLKLVKKSERYIVYQELQKKLREESEIVNNDLQILGCSRDDSIFHIRSVLSDIPTTKYNEYYSTKTNLRKLDTEIAQFATPQSPLYQTVRNGMIRKFKTVEDDEIKEKVRKIVNGKTKSCEGYWKKLCKMKQMLESDKFFVAYKRAKKHMQGYFRRIEEIDKKLGFVANQTGINFENNIEMARVIEYIITRKLRIRLKSFFLRRRRSDIQVLQNIFWKDKAGEVDYVVLDPINRKVLALIECKTSYYDVFEGFKQSNGVYRAKRGKKYLIINNEEILCPYKCPNFVVTKNRVNYWKMESPLKQKLSQIFFKMYKCKATEAEIFEILKDHFGENISPYQWIIKKGNKSKIIVI